MRLSCVFWILPGNTSICARICGFFYSRLLIPCTVFWCPDPLHRSVIHGFTPVYISRQIRTFAETVSEIVPNVHFWVYGDAHVKIMDLGPFSEMALGPVPEMAL
jgi:hypothetical protein